MRKGITLRERLECFYLMFKVADKTYCLYRHTSCPYLKLKRLTVGRFLSVLYQHKRCKEMADDSKVFDFHLMKYYR